MENTQNLSIEVTERNRGIEKNCSNCVYKVTHCPSDQAPCWCCSGHSEWKAVPKFLSSDESFVSWEDYLVKKRIHEEASIFVDYLINSLLK